METKEEKAREKSLQEVKMYQSNDWNLIEETPEYFLLKKNTATCGVHVVIFILTGWFSFGVCNLIYWLLSNKTKKIVK